MNRAHLILCIRSELRKQNMTFHKLPGSSNYTPVFLTYHLDMKVPSLTISISDTSLSTGWNHCPKERTSASFINSHENRPVHPNCGDQWQRYGLR